MVLYLKKTIHAYRIMGAVKGLKDIPKGHNIIEEEKLLFEELTSYISRTALKQSSVSHHFPLPISKSQTLIIIRNQIVAEHAEK